MIKLIATDVDGTLVKESSKEVPQQVIDMIQKLCDKGYYFAIASGRQYGSIRRMFERVDRNLIYIVENGAHIVMDGKNVDLVPMKRNQVIGIMNELRTFYKEDCHVVASAPQGSLLESRDENFIKLISEKYRNDVTLVEDILEKADHIIKLAIYKKESIREIGEQILIPHWTEQVKTCLAGEEWVDFMDKSVDKGNALKKVLQELQLGTEEVMVFGDNENDIGMLSLVENSYVVENAKDNVKLAAKYTCRPYWEDGVCRVLESLL